MMKNDDRWSVPGLGEAWALTQRISPAPVVQAPDVDGGGGVVANNYRRPWGVSNSRPPAAGVWAVRLADGGGVFWLLAFDFDGNDDATFDQVDAFVRILDGVGIRSLVCRSSSRDRRHVWIGMDRAGAGVPAELAEEVGQLAHALYPVLDWGMLRNPVTGACRPPLSPHRDGSVSVPLRGDLDVLLKPSTSTEQIQALRDRLRELAPVVNPVPAGEPLLPPDRALRTRKRLSRAGQEWMATPGGGADPSRTGYLCLLAAAAAGWEFSDVARAAAVAPGMEHYRSENDGRGGRKRRSARQAAKRLAVQWEKAQARAARFQYAPPSEDPRTAEQLAEFDGLVADVEAVLTSFRVSPGRWGGKQGPVTLRSVLSAVAWLTLHAGKRQVAASVRTVALLAGVSERTARVDLDWLAAHGYLSKARGGAGEKAAEWRLGHLPTFSTTSGRKYPHLRKIPRPPAELHRIRYSALEALDLELDAAQQDLFAHAGLGQLAARAYAFLRTMAATVSEISSQLGVSIGRAGRVLSRLRAVGLLATDGSRWRVRKRVKLQQVAERVGTAGIGAVRAVRFERDRVQWRIWLANLEVMHTPKQARPSPTRLRDGGVKFGPAIDWFELEGTLYPYVPREAGPGSRADLMELRWWIDAGHVPTPLPEVGMSYRAEAA